MIDSTTLQICSVLILLLCTKRVVASVLSRHGRLRRMRKLGCEAPSQMLQKDPFLGLDLLWEWIQSMRQHRQTKYYQQCVERYGKTHQSTLLGRTRIFTVEPKNIRAVLGSDFESYGVEPVRLLAMEPLVGKGIMNCDGLAWEHSRTLIRPTFAKKQINDLSHFSSHVDHMLRLIPSDGTAVDMRLLFAKQIIDSSTEFLFGESVNTLSLCPTLDAEEFLAAYEYGQACLSKRLVLGKLNILFPDAKFTRSCEVVHRFADKYADMLLKIGDEKAATAKTSDGRFVLGREMANETQERGELRRQLLNIFTPARDTTGVALTNIIFLLARHPEMWQSLREEVMTVTLEDLTADRLKSFKLLRNVINESSRLHATLNVTARRALRDTVLPAGGGPDGTAPIAVSKGDGIAISWSVLHRNKEVFGDDADSFRPERWDERDPAWPGLNHLPFSYGPRVCPGQDFALTEIRYTMVRLLHAFRAIENRDPVPEFVEEYKVTLASMNGARVAFVPA